MKCASAPSRYRNCILRTSVRTGRNFSPARNVRSITAPSLTRRSLVRTNAPPLPGLTCWNSRILKMVPSTSMCVPLRNWLVLMDMTDGGEFRGGLQASFEDAQLLRQPAQDVVALVGHDHQVLDPYPEATREVDARLDRDHVAGEQRPVRALGQAGALVDLDADPVPEAVAEMLAVAPSVDHRPCHGVDLATAGARLHRLDTGELGAEHQLVDVPRLRPGLPRRERPRAVRAVAVELGAPVDNDQLAFADRNVSRPGVR